MKQQTVIIAALIGLVFGALLSGTLGLDFFGSNEDPDPVDCTPVACVEDDDSESNLKKDEEGFRLAYGLSTSIYIPIEGDSVDEKLTNGETFILYLGRDTCPYCQQYVPNLQEAAENQGLTMIYHVDTVDPLNSAFISTEGVNVTPTTWLVKDGVVVEEIIGYKSVEATEQLIIDHLLD